MKKLSFLFIFLLLIVSGLFCQDNRLIGTWQIVDINPASPLSKTVDTTKTNMKTILSTLESVGVSTQITFNSDTYYQTLNGIRYVHSYKVKNDFIITTVNDTELHQPYSITGNRLTLNDFIYETDLQTTDPAVANIPSAEFDLIMGCFENNAERVKYAIKRGIDYKKIDYWVKWLPKEEKQIIVRSGKFWAYEMSNRSEYKAFGEPETLKEIDAKYIDYSSWVDVISIPIFNQNKPIVKLLMNAGFYDDVVFFYENEECVSYSKTLEAFLVDVIIN